MSMANEALREFVYYNLWEDLGRQPTEDELFQALRLALGTTPIEEEE